MVKHSNDNLSFHDLQLKIQSQYSVIEKKFVIVNVIRGISYPYFNNNCIFNNDNIK